MNTKTFYFTLFIIAVLTSCKQDYSNAETKGKSLKKVRVTAISGLSEMPTISASGKLASKDEVVLSFKTGGILNSLKFEEGQTVNNRAVLASLNLSEINAQVQSAKNAYEKSVRDYERATAMYQDSVGTLEQQQNRKTQLDIAKSQLEIANFNRQYSVINAPFSGTILKKYVESGQLVAPGQPIYLIGTSGNKGAQIIKTGLSDKDVVQIELGDSSTILFDAFLPAGRHGVKAEYNGTVTQIAEVANASTGLYDVEITIDGYFKELKNGFIGTVNVLPASGTSILKIPMNALVEGADKSAMIFYTQDDLTVQETEVEIINLNDDYFTVKVDALPKNAKVVNEGAPFLKVNDSIQIVR